MGILGEGITAEPLHQETTQKGGLWVLEAHGSPLVAKKTEVCAAHSFFFLGLGCCTYTTVLGIHVGGHTLPLSHTQSPPPLCLYRVQCVVVEREENPWPKRGAALDKVEAGGQRRGGRSLIGGRWE